MEKMMKVLKSVVCVAVVVSVLYCVGWYECHYTKDCIVVKVENECVMVEDLDGNYWEFYGDGYTVGKAVRVTFHTNYTDNFIEDDRIEKVDF